jgi:hypothetical protein
LRYPSPVLRVLEPAQAGFDCRPGRATAQQTLVADQPPGRCEGVVVLGLDPEVDEVVVQDIGDEAVADQSGPSMCKHESSLVACDDNQ